ncbi:thioesterase II family protein [Streptomyces goshikiensis]|uniref:thioesterase II family protein n=1 Tax=Streptomyces TaxID=1883 RepID=UPI000C279FC9|nr:alpha/beta fold hydrolase [Streptomyces sp. CB02120-2]PJN17419.1 thioesterase [Streptomyces sp. CB02120-2]
MTGLAAPDRWLKCLGSRPDARLRLIVIPYAGGAAGAFHGWVPAVPPDVEVWAFQLPGRENRLAEPAVRSLADLVPPMADALARLDHKPYVLFGHSMGALLGYELYRRLAERGAALPERLVLSGCASPALSFERPLPRDGTDGEVVHWFRELGGMPEDVDAELVRLMLPTLRADIEVCTTYVHRPGPPVACPVTALAGRTDPVATPGRVAAWGALVSGAFETATRPGGHMFVLVPEFPAFLATLLLPRR